MKSLRLSLNREVEQVMLVPVVVLAVLSFGIFFSLNPLSFAGSWVMQGIGIAVLSQEGALLANNLIQSVVAQDAANQTAHLVTGVLSALLGIAGIAMAIGRYKGKSSEALLQDRPIGPLARFSYNHFYLDGIYAAVLVRPVLWLSRMLYRVDKRVIDYTLEYASKWLVVFAKIVKWFDKWAVDGSVWLIGALSKVVGRFGRGLQNGKVQSYYAYSLFGFILIILYIMLN